MSFHEATLIRRDKFDTFDVGHYVIARNIAGEMVPAGLVCPLCDGDLTRAKFTVIGKNIDGDMPQVSRIAWLSGDRKMIDGVAHEDGWVSAVPYDKVLRCADCDVVFIEGPECEVTRMPRFSIHIDD